MNLQIGVGLLAAIVSIAADLLPLGGTAAAQTAHDRVVSHYDRILVIVEENKGYATIFERGLAPAIAGLAKTYGSATRMYAERHPSEPNYVALIGGDTFGIADDDGWYCVPGSTAVGCKGSGAADYVPHLVEGPNLATQLQAKGLDWKAYLESIPAPGSLAMLSPETDTAPAGLYAAKHTGFTNFASVHADPNLAKKLVGFDALRADLQSGNIPAFSLIVPNQCNEMHGVNSPKSPPDCANGDEGLVRRGDAYVRDLIGLIQGSPIWANGNTAIVLTWDEDGKLDRIPGSVQSCCVPIDAHNPGGGRIPTIVITNHGPRGVVDDTPYDHYSLLRTIEDALGLDGHLRHAGDATVLPMTPLFAHP